MCHSSFKNKEWLEYYFGKLDPSFCCACHNFVNSTYIAQFDGSVKLLPLTY